MKYILTTLLYGYLGYSQLTVAADCIDAYRICDATASYYFEANGDGNVDDANGAMGLYCIANSSVNQWESNSAWFVFTPNYSGQLGLSICPDLVEDWQFALFGNNPNCNDLANSAYQIRCNTQGVTNPAGCTGIGIYPGDNGAYTTQYVNLQAGVTYILVATTLIYPIVAPRKATLTFQGSAVTDHPDLFDHPSCIMGLPEGVLERKTYFYPHPANEQTMVYAPEPFVTAVVSDITGKIVPVVFNDQVLYTSSLQRGVYFIKLIARSGQIVMKKLIKE